MKLIKSFWMACGVVVVIFLMNVGIRAVQVFAPITFTVIGIMFACVCMAWLTYPFYKDEK